MLGLEVFLMLTLAGYGFATAIQMIRGYRLNFKPFNCIFCLTFWFVFFFVLIAYSNIKIAILNSFASSGLSVFLKLIEDKLSFNNDFEDF